MIFGFCRMTAYFNKVGWPEKAPKGEDERKEFIAGLHKRKTDLFMALIEKQLLPLRPGVAKSVTLQTPLTLMLYCSNKTVSFFYILSK